MQPVFAERLRSARILNGLSLQDLAERMENKISRQALHKYEKGEIIPDSDRLITLAAALNVRPDFFTRVTKIEFGEIEFRKLQKLPAKEENRIIEQVRDYLARYIELEQILGIQTRFDNPLKDVGAIASFEDIEKAAEELRRHWKLGIDPVFNAVELLEDRHIKVIQINAGDSFDGMQSWVNGNIPVIAVNIDKVKSPDRIRFTVFHELCHLLLPALADHSLKQREKFCHQFAAAVLLPSKAAVNELGKVRNKILIQELGLLKKQYGISIQAIVMRAKDIGIITDSFCKQFFFFLNQMGWKVNEPEEYNYLGEEKANRFHQLLFRALAEEIISIGKAAALNDQSVADFRDSFMKVH
ncbi:MAG: ImmA/IrrE family metallo-endopeptidase [Chitinophagaceae bacterium]|nr:ImmA/IrrE family metallo-endopeptidase [Chitinophagaceae bacterium]